MCILFHYTVPGVWKSTLLVIGIWNIIFLGPQSQQLAYVIFAISFMGTLILVSVRIILIVALPCFFGEAKPC